MTKRICLLSLFCVLSLLIHVSAFAQNQYFLTNSSATIQDDTAATGDAGGGYTLQNGYLNCTANSGGYGTNNPGEAKYDYVLSVTFTWIGSGSPPSPSHFTCHGTINTSTLPNTGSASALAEAKSANFGFDRTTPGVDGGTYQNSSTFNPNNGIVTASIQAVAYATTTGDGTASASTNVWITWNGD